MSTGKGSGRASAGQFSDKVVDGCLSTDIKPTTRKHWPKPDDSVEQWLLKKRNEKPYGSDAWWTVQGLLVEYQATASQLQYLGNVLEAQ